MFFLVMFVFLFFLMNISMPRLLFALLPCFKLLSPGILDPDSYYCFKFPGPYSFSFKDRFLLGFLVTTIYIFHIFQL